MHGPFDFSDLLAALVLMVVVESNILAVSTSISFVCVCVCVCVCACQIWERLLFTKEAEEWKEKTEHSDDPHWGTHR